VVPLAFWSLVGVINNGIRIVFSNHVWVFGSDIGQVGFIRYFHPSHDVRPGETDG
jgi:hypothetical protein